jgi:hypothetical protein
VRLQPLRNVGGVRWNKRQGEGQASGVELDDGEKACRMQESCRCGCRCWDMPEGRAWRGSPGAPAHMSMSATRTMFAKDVGGRQRSVMVANRLRSDQ